MKLLLLTKENAITDKTTKQTTLVSYAVLYKNGLLMHGKTREKVPKRQTSITIAINRQWVLALFCETNHLPSTSPKAK